MSAKAISKRAERIWMNSDFLFDIFTPRNNSGTLLARLTTFRKKLGAGVKRSNFETIAPTLPTCLTIPGPAGRASLDMRNLPSSLGEEKNNFRNVPLLDKNSSEGNYY